MPTSEENQAVLQGELDSGLRYTVQIPAVVIEKLVAGEKWRGRVSIAPSRRKATKRATAIQQQIKDKRRFRNVTRATVDERKVIRAWNRSRYVQSLIGQPDREPRNHPLEFKKIGESLPLVKKALREVGLQSIIRSMESYFDFCAAGGHIFDGRSHGYKTVTGFLEKLIDLQKNGKEPWWDVREAPAKPAKDDNSRLTRRIANSFAQTFMGDDVFPLDEGSKEERHFQRASAQMVRFISRKKRQGLEFTQTQMIRHLLECVDELFHQEGDPVYPGHLSSSAIWTTALPQHLKERGVL